MFLGWDLNNLQGNLPNIVCLSVFFLAFIIVNLVMIFLFIYKKIMQTIAKTLDLVDDIKKSPLKLNLRRISIIFEETGNFESEFMIWRTKFELIYEKELQKTLKAFGELIKDKKNTRPLLKNFKKFSYICEKVEFINKTIHELFIETRDAIEIEYIQRDSLAFQRELFTKLKEELIILQFSDIDLEKEMLNETLSKIEQLFQNFYICIDDGDYKKSWDCLYKIESALIFLIELLDVIPYILSTITTVIPEMMLELKNKHITFGNNYRKSNKNAENYAKLEASVDALRIKINKNIKRLLYKKAIKNLNKAFNYVEEFRISVEYEDDLKRFFEENAENIRENFELINKASRAIEKAFKNVNISSKTQSKEKLDFEETRAQFIKTKEKSDLIFSKLDVAKNDGRAVDFLEIKDSLLDVMQQALKDIEKLEKSAKDAEKQNTNIDSVYNQVIFMQSILSQCEVKINQYKSIMELNKFTEPINQLYKEIEYLTKENLLKIKTVEEKDRVNNYINLQLGKAWEIASSINDTIFLDFISQEIIIYLERFVGLDKKIDKVIKECEMLFHNRELEQLLGYSLNILGKIKVARR